MLPPETEREELFKAKCLVSALRSKSRDWLDLFILFTQNGFTIEDFESAFEEAKAGSSIDIAFTRLCSGAPQNDDDGYTHLLPNPPALAEMRNFFVQLREKYETEKARRASRQA